jgi:hypothetical protein
MAIFPPLLVRDGVDVRLNVLAADGFVFASYTMTSCEH